LMSFYLSWKRPQTGLPRADLPQVLSNGNAIHGTA